MSMTLARELLADRLVFCFRLEGILLTQVSGLEGFLLLFVFGKILLVDDWVDRRQVADDFFVLKPIRPDTRIRTRSAV